MRWSFRLLTLYGVEVHSHISFPLVLVWAAWQGASGRGGPAGAVYGVVSVVLLFVCVLLHELGHSLEAQRLGLPVRQITLFPLGGVVELGLLPEKPGQEFRVALAGPAVNFGLGVLLGGIAAAWTVAASGDPRASVAAALSGPSALGLLLYLAAANLSLAAFNLIPAFPMDGGRLLRAALAHVLDVVTATRLAAIAGYAFAAALIGFGLYGFALTPGRLPPSLLLIMAGGLVLVGAAYEEYWLRRRMRLSRIRADSAIRLPTWTVTPGEAVTPLLNVHSFQLQPVLPVLLGRRVVGLMLEKDLRTALARPVPKAGTGSGPAKPMTIAHIMRVDFPRLRVTDNLWEALELLMAYGYPALPVVHNGKFEGMISRADVRREASRKGKQADRLRPAVPDIRTISLGEHRNL